MRQKTDEVVPCRERGKPEECEENTMRAAGLLSISFIGHRNNSTQSDSQHRERERVCFWILKIVSFFRYCDLGTARIYKLLIHNKSAFTAANHHSNTVKSVLLPLITEPNAHNIILLYFQIIRDGGTTLASFDPLSGEELGAVVFEDA